MLNWRHCSITGNDYADSINGGQYFTNCVQLYYVSGDTAKELGTFNNADAKEHAELEELKYKLEHWTVSTLLTYKD